MPNDTAQEAITVLAPVYPKIDISSTDYTVANMQLTIQFNPQADITPFLNLGVPIDDLSFNVYYLYPTTNPTSAALLGTYNVSGDYIDYSGTTPTLSSTPLILSVGAFDQATAQAFTSGSNQKLLILPYVYNSTAVRDGCPDPLPPSSIYSPEYYRTVRTIMPLPSSPPTIAYAYMDGSSGDIVVTMYAPSTTLQIVNVYLGDSSTVTLPITTDTTNFFTDGGMSYLYIKTNTKNNTTGLYPIAVGNTIKITVSNYVGETAHSNAIEVFADDIRNPIVGAVDNNDGTITVTLANSVSADVTFKAVYVDSAGVLAYMTPYSAPITGSYTVLFSKPGGVDPLFFSEELMSDGDGVYHPIWSTPQVLTITPPPSTFIVHAALKHPTNKFITITMDDPGFTPPPTNISVYQGIGESHVGYMPAYYRFVSAGKLYFIVNDNADTYQTGSTFKFAAVNSTTEVETVKSDPILLTEDTLYCPTINASVSANDGTNVSLTVTDSNTVTMYYIMSKSGKTIIGSPASSGTSKTVTFPVPSSSVTLTYLLAIGAPNAIMSTPLQFTIPTGTLQPSVPCFLATAPVLTPSGYRRIGTLAAGDKVVTGDGRAVAIERVHRSQVAAGPTTNPYVIPKGQYGATRRLLISPNHRVQTESGMIEARHMGLAQEELTGTLDYYNLELPATTDTMVVAGVTVESMAPVRRIVVPFAVFSAMITKKYGAVTPALMANIKRTCRVLQNGHIECPVLANK